MFGREGGWKILRFSFPHRFKDVDFLVPVVVVLSDFRSNLSIYYRTTLYTLKDDAAPTALAEEVHKRASYIIYRKSNDASTVDSTLPHIAPHHNRGR